MDQKEKTYAVYARKSSTDETRQVQSIERQLTDLQRVIEEEKLHVSRRQYVEEQSAFKLGRKVFAELAKATKKGKINCWLCWHPNRLARNATDAGKIIQLMDDGYLLEIRTPTKTYYNTSNDKTFLMIDLTFSKRDSDDKSEVVKSGMRKRYERGFPSGLPPLGFMLQQHSSTRSTWVVDEERNDLVRKVFKRFLRGDLSVREITQYAHRIGLHTVRRGKLGNTPASSGLVYFRILRNPIYAGFFRTPGGDRFTLNSKLPRLLSEEEHRKVLSILSSRKTNKGRRPLIDFLYRDLLKDTLGRRLIAENKHQLRCDCGHKFAYRLKKVCPRCQVPILEIQAPQYLSYTYYSCKLLDSGGRLRTKAISELRVEAFLFSALTSILGTDEVGRPSLREVVSQENLRCKTRENLQLRSFAEKGTRIKFEKKHLRVLATQGLITLEEFKEDLLRLDEEYESSRSGVKSSYVVDFQEIIETLENCHQALLGENQDEKKSAVQALPFSIEWNGGELCLKPGLSLKDLLQKWVTSIEHQYNQYPNTRRLVSTLYARAIGLRMVILGGLAG